ncbi:DNA-directed RNA polymerase subunit beta [Nocardia vinacea]|uniref:DNA-directed RNA polymerase subunit beta n=1 Tax=Nocardia vinacea TaxID=96468 RepID=A0ABZ1YI02_9NOCA|nr:DNA-directed RNA polymerase subunit beta [Nocardia vinacea]
MSADTPQTRCEFYRRTCELPAQVDPTSGRITMRANLIWGLMMPSVLAQQVKRRLEVDQRGVGPIVLHPRSNTWTFIVRSDVPLNAFNGLYKHQVQVINAGGEIALPSPAPQGGLTRSWIIPPNATYRPSGFEVVNALRAVVGLGGARVRVEQ